jgi:hypothetical protein
MVRSQFSLDRTGLRSGSARPYGPVFLSVSLFELETGPYFGTGLWFYGPDGSSEMLDRSVRSFLQFPKKAPVRTGPDRGQSIREG